MTLLEIVDNVDSLILEKAVLARFRNYVTKLCKIVESYGQAQQPYSRKLENLEKAIDKGKFIIPQAMWRKRPDGSFRGPPLVELCPPPKGYVKMNYWDNNFINVPLGTIYRPAEPVNPLLWFGLSGDTSLQRKPSENERLMCDYVRLAIIHDYELRYSGTPTDSYIISDKYKGKWFERDGFCRDFWTHYRNNNEKLSHLHRAREHVQADLAKKPETGRKATLAKIWACIKRIPRWIYVLVIFLAALLGILEKFGCLEPIKTFIRNISWPK
jgi:hypothetical protein